MGLTVSVAKDLSEAHVARLAHVVLTAKREGRNEYEMRTRREENEDEMRKQNEKKKKRK